MLRKDLSWRLLSSLLRQKVLLKHHNFLQQFYLHKTILLGASKISYNFFLRWLVFCAFTCPFSIKCIKDKRKWAKNQTIIPHFLHIKSYETNPFSPKIVFLQEKIKKHDVEPEMLYMGHSDITLQLHYFRRHLLDALHDPTRDSNYIILPCCRYCPSLSTMVLLGPYHALSNPLTEPWF